MYVTVKLKVDASFMKKLLPLPSSSQFPSNLGNTVKAAADKISANIRGMSKQDHIIFSPPQIMKGINV